MSVLTKSYIPKYSYDPIGTDPISVVRSVIGDTDFSIIDGDDTTAIFDDQTLQGYINKSPANDPTYAAITALRARATALMMVSGGSAMKIGDFSFDPTGAAKNLNMLADSLQADYEGLPAEADAEVDYNDTSYRRLVINQAITTEV